MKIARGVTLHGFALNVTVDLAPFANIVPCGIEGCRVTSMAEVLRREVALHDVRHRIARCFGDVFGLEWRDSLLQAPPAADVNVRAGHIPGLVG